MFSKERATDISSELDLSQKKEGERWREREMKGREAGRLF